MSVELLHIGASIVIKDVDGHTVFDTAERLMTVTDQKTGTKACSGYFAFDQNSTHSYTNVDTLHALASVHPDADTVRGSFKVTTAGGDGALHNIGWFNASGTYIHYQGSSGPVGGPIGTQSTMTQMALYTFKCFGGTLYLRECVFLRPTFSINNSIQFSVTMSAPTFQYNLLCGLFI